MCPWLYFVYFQLYPFHFRIQGNDHLLFMSLDMLLNVTLSDWSFCPSIARRTWFLISMQGLCSNFINHLWYILFIDIHSHLVFLHSDARCVFRRFSCVSQNRDRALRRRGGSVVYKFIGKQYFRYFPKEKLSILDLWYCYKLIFLQIKIINSKFLVRLRYWVFVIFFFLIVPFSICWISQFTLITNFSPLFVKTGIF